MSGITEQETIFVSFSGGADSLTLLLKAVQMYPVSRICAVHFEHGLRGGESLADADFCKEFCESREIPFLLVPLDVPANRQHGEGDEAAARRLRLEAWKKIINGRKNAVVLLGHHGDDAVETMLIRLCRGSNVSGLTALREERTVQGIRFRRPLLDMTRKEIEDFLRQQGIRQWCTDRTNEQDIYFRNYLRNDLLPSLAEHAPFAPGGLRQAILSLADDAAYLEDAAFQAYESCRTEGLSAWKELHPALLIRVLRLLLEPAEILPSRNLAERLRSALRNNKTEKIPVNGRYFLRVNKQGVSLAEYRDAPEQQWFWRTESVCGDLTAELIPASPAPDLTDGAAYFDAAELPEYFRLTPWRSGDTILSFDGKRKNLKRLFCDQHIPAEKRVVLRGEAGDDRIFLAPGVRHSAEAPVTHETKHILKITFTPSQQGERK